MLLIHLSSLDILLNPLFHAIHYMVSKKIEFEIMVEHNSWISNEIWRGESQSGENMENIELEMALCIEDDF